jgi:hypothetical protein
MTAEDHVQKVAVERRARELRAHRQSTCGDVHPAVVEYLFAVETDQVGGDIAAPAKDLLPASKSSCRKSALELRPTAPTVRGTRDDNARRGRIARTRATT